MDYDKIDVELLSPKTATLGELTALNKFFNIIRLEHLPDDPPTPLEETIQNLQNLPSYADILISVVWDPHRIDIIGESDIVILRVEENKHMAQFDLSVRPEHRRKGIGRALLIGIAETAQSEKRRLLITSTNDRQEGGEAFMTRIGAQKGLEAHTNQLNLEELNRGLVLNWLEKGKENLAQFEIGFWDGAFPEEDIVEICKLYELTNQQPFGDLEIEDMRYTPDQIRQMETNLFARGSQRWTCYVKERSSGNFAGYTETVWNPNRPQILRQDMTGVFPEYRKKGLGRWLKASMIDRVLRDRPSVKYVRTGNADSNTTMLTINNQLGFKPYSSDILWQVELSKVQEYLQERR